MGDESTGKGKNRENIAIKAAKRNLLILLGDS